MRTTSTTLKLSTVCFDSYSDTTAKTRNDTAGSFRFEMYSSRRSSRSSSSAACCSPSSSVPALMRELGRRAAARRRRRWSRDGPRADRGGHRAEPRRATGSGRASSYELFQKAELRVFGQSTGARLPRGNRRQSREELFVLCESYDTQRGARGGVELGAWGGRKSGVGMARGKATARSVTPAPTGR